MSVEKLSRMCHLKGMVVGWDKFVMVGWGNIMW